MEDLIIAIGLPVTIICIIAVVLCVLSMAWAFGSGHKPAVRYTLDKEWDREPLLFSAVDVAPVAPPAASRAVHRRADRRFRTWQVVTSSRS